VRWAASRLGWISRDISEQAARPSGFAEGPKAPAKFLGGGANPCDLPPATLDSVEGALVNSPTIRLGFLQPE
jgi:hypothetical protein